MFAVRRGLFSLCGGRLLLWLSWRSGRLLLWLFVARAEPAVPVRRKVLSELGRYIVEGESVEAAEVVAKIVSSVVAGGSALPGPGGGSLPQPRRDVGVSRR